MSGRTEIEDEHHHLDVIKLLASKVLDATTSSFVIVEDDAKIIIHEAQKVVTEAIKAGSRPSSAQTRRSRPTSALPRPASATRPSEKSIGESAHLIANTSVNSIITEVLSRPPSASLPKTNSSIVPTTESVPNSSSKTLDKSVTQSTVSQTVDEVTITSIRPSSAATSAKSPETSGKSSKEAPTSSVKSVPSEISLVAQSSVNDILAKGSSRPASASVPVSDVPSIAHASSSSGKVVSNDVHLVAQSSVKDIIDAASSRPSSAAVTPAAAAASSSAKSHDVGNSSGKSERSKTPIELAAASVAGSAVSFILTEATSRPSSALIHHHNSNLSASSTESASSVSQDKPPLIPKSASSGSVGQSTASPVVVSPQSPQRSTAVVRPVSAPMVTEIAHSLASSSVSSFLSSGASAAAAAEAQRPLSAAPSTPSVVAPATSPSRSPKGQELVQNVQRAAQSTATEAIQQATVSTSRPSSAASSPVKDSVAASSGNRVTSPAAASPPPATPAAPATVAAAPAPSAVVPAKSTVVAATAAASKTTKSPRGNKPITATTSTGDIMEAHLAAVSMVSDVIVRSYVSPRSLNSMSPVQPPGHVRFNDVATVVPTLERKLSVETVGEPSGSTKESSGSNKETLKMFENFSSHHPGQAISAVSLDFVTAALRRGSLSYHEKHYKSKKGVNFAAGTTLMEGNNEEDAMDLLPAETLAELRDTESFDAESTSEKAVSVDKDSGLFRSMSGLTENTLDYIEVASSNSTSIDLFNKFSAAQHAETQQNTASNARVESTVTTDDLELQIYEDLSETPKAHSKRFDHARPDVKPKTAPAALAAAYDAKSVSPAATTALPPVVPSMVLPSESKSSTAAAVKPSPRVAGPTMDRISPRPIIASAGGSSKISTAVIGPSSDTVFLNKGGAASVSPAPSPSDSMMSDVNRFSGLSPRPNASTGTVPGPKVDALLDSLVKGSPRLTSQQAVTAIMKISPRLVSPRAGTSVRTQSAGNRDGASAKVSGPSSRSVAATSKEEIEAQRRKAEQDRAEQLRVMREKQQKLAEQESRIREARKTKSDMEHLLGQLQRDLSLMDEKKEAKNHALMEALQLLQTQMHENNQLLVQNRK